LPDHSSLAGGETGLCEKSSIAPNAQSKKDLEKFDWFEKQSQAGFLPC